MSGRTIAFPLAATPDGRTAVTTDLVETLDQLIVELLFTAPGERLNRPTFGCGVKQLVFDALTDELVVATQFQIQSQLQQWLGTLLRILSVRCETDEAEAVITVAYQPLGHDRPRVTVVRG
ncbi:MAG TPA: GPW/gp25 family protein [Iamia sp.]|nr:GPW/gp25 family protein [Iamia sp.]